MTPARTFGILSLAWIALMGLAGSILDPEGFDQRFPIFVILCGATLILGEGLLLYVRKRRLIRSLDRKTPE